MALKVTAELDKARAELVDRAKRLLDEIEHSVLPSDPEEALALLTEFILHDIFGAQDWLPESAASQLLVRAVDLAVLAAENTPLPERPRRETIN